MDSHMDWHALRAALDWQVELGADEAIGETPVNRFEAAAEAVAQVAAKAAEVSAAPVSEQVDPVAVARAAARDAADLESLKAALDAYEHCDLRRGARKVLISAPAKNVARTVVYGVNHRELLPEDGMVSNGSCTTNCLAPLAKVLDEAFGIESGIMTTVHSYTGDQPTLDRRHKDLYRARAAAMAMIPTSTGAAKALGEVLPNLKGKLDGTALRVPTPNVSAVDLTFEAGRDVTVDEVNAAVKDAASGRMGTVLAYDPEPKVSIDFNHTTASSIFAPDQTKVVGKRLVRVLAWYDNEWGFSARMADVAAAMGRLLH